VSLNEAAELLDGVLDEIASGLKNHGLVKLTGFGNFVARTKNTRVGRNPKTNKEAIISARKSIAFNASNILKQKVNK
jgi:integration host factor subunit alpha